MSLISKNALVPYTAAEMYSLVDDIAAYPSFLPWCKDAKVLSRDEDEVRATIAIAKSGVHKSFTTFNRLQHNKMIEMRLLEGPFHHLEGFWRFDALDDRGCKVSLDLEFEFSNKIIRLTVGPVFDQVANTLVDAFCERAIEVYGKR